MALRLLCKPTRARKPHGKFLSNTASYFLALSAITTCLPSRDRVKEVMLSACKSVSCLASPPLSGKYQSSELPPLVSAKIKPCPSADQRTLTPDVSGSASVLTDCPPSKG